MIKVKVCGMTDPLNVRGITQTNPDYVGFIFYKGSPRYVGEEPDINLFRNVPSGIKKAGVFLNENPARILKITQRIGLDIIQLHGNESPDYCDRLKSSGLTIVKVFNISNEFSFEMLIPYCSKCDYFLFDTKSDKPGGSGRKFEWGKLEEYSLDKPFFLSGGIGPLDTVQLKSILNRGFYAIDINSRFELSPGIKDPGLVKTFIDSLKNEQL